MASCRCVPATCCPCSESQTEKRRARNPAPSLPLQRHGYRQCPHGGANHIPVVPMALKGQSAGPGPTCPGPAQGGARGTIRTTIWSIRGARWPCPRATPPHRRNGALVISQGSNVDRCSEHDWYYATPINLPAELRTDGIGVTHAGWPGSFTRLTASGSAARRLRRHRSHSTATQQATQAPTLGTPAGSAAAIPIPG